MPNQAPSSSQSAYVLPSVTWVTTTSLITTGDAGTQPIDANWKFAGIPDGIGAFDNGDGTLTVVVNHELGSAAGVVREHGFNGAFVDVLTVDAQTGEVLHGDDLAQQAFSWTGSDYGPLTAAWNRFCSGDLAAPSAYYDADTGLGTQERIYLTGEEAGAEGRAFAFVLTDTDKTDGTAAGTAYELPALGNTSFENVAANPASGAKTVLISQDDSAGGQLYVYVGDKQATGSALDKAGLSDGQLYGIRVPTLATETSATVLPSQGVAFTLQEMGPGGDAAGLTGAQLQTESVAEGVTGFLRPEDGAWDPSNPNRYYFVTTNAFDQPSRLWSLEFTNAQDPQAGGVLKMLLDGSEGQHMFDNITVTDGGLVILQEDPGGNPYIAKMWMYDPAADALTEIAHSDPTRFLSGGADFLTQDEESSGVVDVTSLMGDGNGLALLFDTQAHYSTDGELVEGGQLQLMRIDLPTNAQATLVGTNDADVLTGTNKADVVDGDFGDDTIGGGAGDDRLLGGYGADSLDGGQGADSLVGDVGADQLAGGQGDDQLSGGVGADVLEGGQGDDGLDGGVDDDRLSGSEGSDTLSGGYGSDSLDGGQGSDKLDGGNGDDMVIGGQGADTLSGGFGADIFAFSRGSGADVITDFHVGEDHIQLLDGASVQSISEVDLDHDGAFDASLLTYQGGSITFLGVLSTAPGDFLA